MADGVFMAITGMVMMAVCACLLYKDWDQPFFALVFLVGLMVLGISPLVIYQAGQSSVLGKILRDFEDSKPLPRCKVLLAIDHTPLRGGTLAFIRVKDDEGEPLAYWFPADNVPPKEFVKVKNSTHPYVAYPDPGRLVLEGCQSRF